MFIVSTRTYIVYLVLNQNVKMFPIAKIRKKPNQETRWNRIERKHINAIKLPGRTAEGAGNYLSYLRNKTFFKDYHIKMLNGDDSLQNRLDPNLVMNIRHENVG